MASCPSSVSDGASGRHAGAREPLIQAGHAAGGAIGLDTIDQRGQQAAGDRRVEAAGEDRPLDQRQRRLHQAHRLRILAHGRLLQQPVQARGHGVVTDADPLERQRQRRRVREEIERAAGRRLAAVARPAHREQRQIEAIADRRQIAGEDAIDQPGGVDLLRAAERARPRRRLGKGQRAVRPGLELQQQRGRIDQRTPQRPVLDPPFRVDAGEDVGKATQPIEGAVAGQEVPLHPGIEPADGVVEPGEPAGARPEQLVDERVGIGRRRADQLLPQRIGGRSARRRHPLAANAQARAERREGAGLGGDAEQAMRTGAEPGAGLVVESDGAVVEPRGLRPGQDRRGEVRRTSPCDGRSRASTDPRRTAAGSSRRRRRTGWARAATTACRRAAVAGSPADAP